ncbi:MAG: NAD(P)-dependent dehydrogenase (short-subunit alcohol dehydrogenase family) [Lentisphaeria bacterium]|jgi:NAD(P)-dependent dehydrogenase (short-subunit alcohol dehydrogenase family)
MKQNIVITGANRGIGLAMTKEYVNKGGKVYAVCRAKSLELSETGAQVIEGIDVADEGSVKQLSLALAGVAIDVLINNAGILQRESLDAIDYNSIMRQLQVNALGPLRVSEALLDNLHPGAKVALITSRMGSISDNSSGGYYGYRMSKAALNAAAISLTCDLKPKGVAVAILHPGFVQTDMVNHAGDISAEVAAQRLIQRVDGLNMENTGTFWHSSGEVLSW